MNTLEIKDQKLFIDGVELKSVTELQINKKTSNFTELILKMDVNVEGIDVID